MYASHTLQREVCRLYRARSVRNTAHVCICLSRMYMYIMHVFLSVCFLFHSPIFPSPHITMACRGMSTVVKEELDEVALSSLPAADPLEEPLVSINTLILPEGFLRGLYDAHFEDHLAAARSWPCSSCVENDEPCEQSTGFSWRCKRCLRLGLGDCEWEIQTRKSCSLVLLRQYLSLLVRGRRHSWSGGRSQPPKAQSAQDIGIFR